MVKVQLIYLLIPVLLMLAALGVNSYRKQRPFYRLFDEAQQHEDKGEYLTAIEMYEAILDQYRQFKFKDGQMIKHVIQRLKTLRSKKVIQKSGSIE